MSNSLVDAISGREVAHNLDGKERAISVIGGLVLAAMSVRLQANSKPLGLLALIGGAALALRGASGYCPLKSSVS